VGAAFGVAGLQVERDHLISHCLMAIAKVTEPLKHPPVFFGGTALARTWLPEGRLSEDIDLYVVDRPAAVEVLESSKGLRSMLRREFPDLRWQTPLSTVRDTDAALLRSGQISLRLQLLRAEGGYERWPTESRSLVMRYADCRDVSMMVPTLPAFAAMKTSAWSDRHTSRDLWDLAKLSTLGAIGGEAARLLRKVAGIEPAGYLFRSPPSIRDWNEALSAQTRDVGEASTALAAVDGAWAPYY
jgi:Nucleotidyl transferase AbiEii toxin, Type IV TA system